MLGKTKDTLFMAAASLVLFGPWQVRPTLHGLRPKPTENYFLFTFWRTFAGNLALARLRILELNFMEYVVSLNFGSLGLRRGSFGLWVEKDNDLDVSYLRNPVAVVLSKVVGLVP